MKVLYDWIPSVGYFIWIVLVLLIIPALMRFLKPMFFLDI
jgi:hypothetical protein